MHYEYPPRHCILLYILKMTWSLSCLHPITMGSSNNEDDIDRIITDIQTAAVSAQSANVLSGAPPISNMPFLLEGRRRVNEYYAAHPKSKNGSGKSQTGCGLKSWFKQKTGKSSGGTSE